MDSVNLIGLALCLLFTLAFFRVLNLVTRRSHTSQDKLPPGPTPLPIIGNLLDLGDKPHKSLANLAQAHGPLMSLRLGQVITIVISSSHVAKEFLQTHDLTFADRAIVDAARAHAHHEASVAWLPVGAPWRKLRKICNSNIFSSQKLDCNQHLRSKKIQELLSDVRESSRAGEAVDIGRAAFKANLNALSSTVFSLDLADSNSDTVREFKEVVRCIMDELGKPNLADYFPLLRKIDPQGIRRRISVHFGRMLELFDRIIDERLKLRNDEGFVPTNDILDALLTIREGNPEELNINQIKHLFLDLIAAGTDTTASTLEWALAELLRQPDTLVKVQEEIHQAIGKNRLIEELDISQLHYLQAVIKETLRLHPPTPLLLPRKARGDLKMSDFTIPEGAQVLINAWAIGRDPNVWEDPNSFMPERFLGSDIDVRGQNFELIPFGAGRRICPAVPLAMRMLPLMLGTLVQFFNWEIADGVVPERLDMEDKFGITLQKARPLLAVPKQL